jgi:quercetin dioxygenase-like cupin family protein
VRRTAGQLAVAAGATIGALTTDRLQTTSNRKEERMDARRHLKHLGWLLALVMGIGIGTAIGQQSPPPDNKGLDAKIVSTVDLAPDMAGYQLRLRKLTFEPGGIAGVHSHKERPAFAYILEGTLTEGREGGYAKQYNPGDVITESRDVTHWAENKSGGKVVLIGIDIVKP